MKEVHMAEIFSAEALAGILADEGLSAQKRVERVLALHGQAVEAALARHGQAADPRQSDEYRALEGEFQAYRAMQAARVSREYAEVKPKFFEAVYGLVDRGEGAKPLGEQLAQIREAYEEYFTGAGGAGPATGGNSPVPSGGGLPAMVLPAAGHATGERLSLSEAMRRANAGEAVDVGRIGKV